MANTTERFFVPLDGGWHGANTNTNTYDVER